MIKLTGNSEEIKDAEEFAELHLQKIKDLCGGKSYADRGLISFNYLRDNFYKNTDICIDYMHDEDSEGKISDEDFYYKVTWMLMQRPLMIKFSICPDHDGEDVLRDFDVINYLK